VTVGGRKTTRRAIEAWRKRNSIRKYRINKQVERGTCRLRPFRENVRTHYEGRKELKVLGGGRPRYLKKLQLEITVNFIKTNEKRIGLELGKRAHGSSVALRNIKNWMLWKNRPLPKRLKCLLA
jgi:hypothetical protein